MRPCTGMQYSLPVGAARGSDAHAQGDFTLEVGAGLRQGFGGWLWWQERNGMGGVPGCHPAAPAMAYLEKHEIDAMLCVPDRARAQGWRDYALPALSLQHRIPCLRSRSGYRGGSSSGYSVRAARRQGTQGPHLSALVPHRQGASRAARTTARRSPRSADLRQCPRPTDHSLWHSWTRRADREKNRRDRAFSARQACQPAYRAPCYRRPPSLRRCRHQHDPRVVGTCVAQD